MSQPLSNSIPNTDLPWWKRGTHTKREYLDKITQIQQDIDAGKNVPIASFPGFNMSTKIIPPRFLSTFVVDGRSFTITRQSANFALAFTPQGIADDSDNYLLLLEKFLVFCQVRMGFEFGLDVKGISVFMVPMGSTGPFFSWQCLDLLKTVVIVDRSIGGGSVGTEFYDGKPFVVAYCYPDRDVMTHEVFHYLQRMLPTTPQAQYDWPILHETSAELGSKFFSLKQQPDVWKGPVNADLFSGADITSKPYVGFPIFFTFMGMYGITIAGQLFCDTSIPNESMLERAMRLTGIPTLVDLFAFIARQFVTAEFTKGLNARTTPLTPAFPTITLRQPDGTGWRRIAESLHWLGMFPVNVTQLKTTSQSARIELRFEPSPSDFVVYEHARTGDIITTDRTVKDLQTYIVPSSVQFIVICAVKRASATDPLPMVWFRSGTP